MAQLAHAGLTATLEPSMLSYFENLPKTPRGRPKISKYRIAGFPFPFCMLPINAERVMSYDQVVSCLAQRWSFFQTNPVIPRCIPNTFIPSKNQSMQRRS